MVGGSRSTPSQGVSQLSKTQRFARWVTDRRFPLALALLFASLFFAYPILNTAVSAIGWPLPGPIVRIDTVARDLYPDHPYIHAQDAFAGTFGGSSVVALAVTVDGGTIFRPDVLRALREITRELDGHGFDPQSEARERRRDEHERNGSLSVDQVRERLDREFPPYPVNHDQVRSLTHPSTRVFSVLPDGATEQAVLVAEVPRTQAEADALRAVVRQQPPAVFGRLVSRDEQAALVTAGFVTDRLASREVHRAVFEHVQRIRQKWEAEVPGLRVYVAGDPIATGWILAHAFSVAGFVLATIVSMFALLWLYFRRWHGVFIPAIAALLTTVWGLGFTGWVGMHFDPLILVIPLIITARAVSHTVQMAERFFEDYAVMLPLIGDPKRARVEAATSALGELVVPGTLGIATDVAGLLVILVTTIAQMRDLAIFGAFWVAAIVVTVEILHPILLCYLPAPASHERYVPRVMERFTRAVGIAVTHPRGKYAIAAVTVVLFAGCTAIALTRSQIGEASPGTPLLWPDHELNVATAEIARRFGGVDSLVVYADGDRPNAAADAAPIRALERLERALASETDLRAGGSIVPLLREMSRIDHYGDPKWSTVPEDTGTVRAMVFQLRQNGPPGFLRPYMSDDGRDANAAFFYADHRGDTVRGAVHAAEAFIEQNPLGEVAIRLDRDLARPGAPFFDPASLLDKAYYMLGPILPARHHTLSVRIRQPDGSYRDDPVRNADADGMPAWLDAFRAAAGSDRARGDVGQWWESEKLGIRAVEVDTTQLFVEDTKAVDGAPRFSPTNSWTRGVQLVMAGGSIGTTAAINEEVERSHVANISLIFLAIFALHSITYRSLPSGGIILLQIATATMISLATMALRGVGLNVHTLPVQSVGVGIGVDYAIYIVDRIRQETVHTHDIDEAIRRAVRTTGLAVTFTATTITGGIFLWIFSDLRFQAEMAYLLVILMLLNMIGAITVVPAFYSILRPKAATALLGD